MITALHLPTFYMRKSEARKGAEDKPRTQTTSTKKLLGVRPISDSDKKWKHEGLSSPHFSAGPSPKHCSGHRAEGSSCDFPVTLRTTENSLTCRVSLRWGWGGGGENFQK